MKNRKNRVLAMVLIVVMALGLVPSALAYSTPDFSDVPQGHWAYEAVMKMADAGVIKGVGEGLFAPEGKLTAEMFVVLVGRVVFPEIKAEGADWSGPYVAEAKSQGLLAGTNVTDSSLKGEISRYDMAVILAKCVEILKVNATKADSSKVADYGEVPAKYIDAVLMAYGSGLIRGDQAGSFNGQNSMTRQEAATVMDRLLGLKGGSQGGATEPTTAPEPSATTDPDELAKADEKAQAEKEAQEAFEASRTGEYVTVNFYGRVTGIVPVGTRVGIYYKDGRLLGETTTDGTLDSTNYSLWSMDVTMDKADFSWTEKLYYAAVIGQVEWGTLLVETPAWVKERPQSINENTIGSTHGFLARLEPVSPDSK